MRFLLIAALCIAGLASQAGARTIQVCATRSAGCDFMGTGSIQAAIDAAAHGDVLRLRAGRYVPAAARDVPFKEVAIRGYNVIEGKTLTIVGDEGAVLDGVQGIPSTAFVLRNADVSFRNLTIQNFRYGEQDDNFYDGHGIFAINSRVDVENVTMHNIVKMAITGRGDTLISARNLKLLKGHLGVWLEESAHAHISNSVMSGGDSAAIAAYMDSSVNLYNSVIENYEDDGIYTKGRGAVFVSNSIISNNKPYAINAVENGRVLVVHSVVHGNAALVNPDVPKGQLQFGEGVINSDPMLGPDYRPRAGSPIFGKTDPDTGRGIGLVSAK